MEGSEILFDETTSRNRKLTAMEQYRLLLAEVGAFLKAPGFSKKGNTCYIQKEGNFGLINFQKSISSTKHQVKFTINIGVASGFLLRAGINGFIISGKPSITDCHWKMRIGFLMPVKKDFWWEIDGVTPVGRMAEDIITNLQSLVIPEILRNISDKDLIEEWIQGRGEGITEFQRYVYLTILLKFYQDERLARVIEELKSYSKGTSIEIAAIEHLKELDLLAKA
jgi:hypothetical protein